MPYIRPQSIALESPESRCLIRMPVDRIFLYLRYMNKGRRTELAALKRKKRLRLYKVDASQKWTHKLKNHATLCSCMFCSPSKALQGKMKHSDVKKGVFVMSLD